ncbi:hypothetical protein [Acetatifactor muris]|uniref:hypothetical protein n=1 Tax=Acetatifactor muris TaxID=879566 RepID=UPI0023F3EAA5|nr:hypothetical protein [Acetatifactor muris]
MIKTEIYRIISRKTALAAMLVTTLTVIYFSLGNTLWGEGVIDGGIIYHGEAAVARDKEITAAFTGPLTEDTVRAIWEKYGPPVNYDNRSTTLEGMTAAAADGGNDNYCNRFVAKWFCRAIQGEDGETVYVLPEDLTGNQYLQGNVWFGYAGNGGNGYWDIFLIAYILACVTISIALCPMFSEDYAFRTTDIILATEKGRIRLWWIRILTGAGFASLFYWMLCAIIFLEQLTIYGSESLKVGSTLAGRTMHVEEGLMSLGRAILLLYLSGWFSVVVLSILVLAVSAGCRKTFSALIISLLVYMGPFACMRVVLDMLPMGRVNAFFHYICYAMPFSFPGIFLEAPSNAKGLLAGIALTAAVLGLALGGMRYCRHQVSRN